MPVYPYKCLQCGKTVEVILRLHELGEVITCKSCAAPMERQPTSAAIAFKGDGWTPKHY